MAALANVACGNSILRYVVMSSKLMKRDVGEHGTRKIHVQFTVPRRQDEVSSLMYKSMLLVYIRVARMKAKTE